MTSYVVFGASRGIGLEFVRQLSANPSSHVFALARNPSKAQPLQALVDANKHGNVHVLRADLNDYESIKAAVEEVARITGGTLDVLINNAALIDYERDFVAIDQFPDAQTLEKDLELFFKTNVVAIAHTLNLFLPLLRRASGSATTPSKAISISSNIANVDLILNTGFAFSSGYAVSKAALNTLVAKFAVSEKARDRSGSREVVFASVSPGLVKTYQAATQEEVEARYDAILGALLPGLPDLRAITPEESVRLQLELFDRLTAKESGGFYNRDGSDGFAKVI